MLILAIIVIAIVAGWAANVVVGKGKRYSTQELFFAGHRRFVRRRPDLQSHRRQRDRHRDLSGLIGSTIGAVVVLVIYAPIRQRMAATNTTEHDPQALTAAAVRIRVRARPPKRPRPVRERTGPSRGRYHSGR